eukprot:110842-Pleurochrysis_carterae.AAC.1
MSSTADQSADQAQITPLALRCRNYPRLTRSVSREMHIHNDDLCNLNQLTLYAFTTCSQRNDRRPSLAIIAVEKTPNATLVLWRTHLPQTKNTNSNCLLNPCESGMIREGKDINLHHAGCASNRAETGAGGNVCRISHKAHY